LFVLVWFANVILTNGGWREMEVNEFTVIPWI
jgi:hypothetical protein